MPRAMRIGSHAPWLTGALIVALAAGVPACGSDSGAAAVEPGHPGEDGSIVYLDAGTGDGGTNGDAALPAVCDLVRTTPPSEIGCRADWLCANGGLYTFVCGPVDGGAATCYCLTNGNVVTTSSAGSCEADGGDFTTEAARVCGWDFAGAGSDGGTP